MTLSLGVKVDMSRTKKYKLMYLVAVILASTIALLFIYKFKENYYVLSLIVILLILPGRVQGYLWRDFFIGRRLLSLSKYEEAIQYFETFEHKLRNNKWLKYAIWLAAFIYTRSIMVMTLNNIGACYLELGELEKARNYFESALEEDRESPLPFYNLSIISEIEGFHDLAIKQYNTSVKLGYSRTTIDQMVHKAGEIYAYIEGRGRSATGGA